MGEVVWCLDEQRIYQDLVLLLVYCEPLLPLHMTLDYVPNLQKIKEKYQLSDQNPITIDARSIFSSKEDLTLDFIYRGIG
ncbi:MAG: hypothetical protein ACFFC6_12655 [Promethearchaeota archaeon]